MMPDSRFGSSLVLALALVFASCSASPDGGSAPQDAEDENIDRGGGHHPRDARLPDAVVLQDAVIGDAVIGPADAVTADAVIGPADAGVALDAGISPDAPGGGDPAPQGSVSCYSDFSPAATCTLPSHCCFTNYNAQHAGSCESQTQSCGWGTIDCDGPEDCATGQSCCAHVIIDPVEGITGYRLACQASACGAAPAHRELCHPGRSAAGTCSSGNRCASASEHAFDLPRTLFVCE